MEKQAFMRKLKGELRWHLSSSELHKVVQEYEGYFAAASGSNAGTTIAELGDPALVAAEILSERYGKVANTKMPLGLAFSFVVFAVTFFTYIINPYLGNARFYWETGDKWYLNGLQLLVLTPTVSAFLVYPRIKALQSTPIMRLAVTNIIVWAIGLLGLFAANHALVTLLSDSINPSALVFWGFVPMNRIGPFISNGLLIFSIALAAFTIATLLRIFHEGQMAIPLLYLNCTGFFAVYHYLMMLNTMDSLEGFTSALSFIVMAAMVGVAITGIVFIAIFIYTRKRISK